MTTITAQDFRRCCAERINLAAREHVELRALLGRAVIDVAEDYCALGFVISLRTYIHGLTKQRVTINERWPADWWEAFKERWFPARLLRRYPVQYREIYVDQPIYLAVCPHVHDEPLVTHLQWLAQCDASEVKK